ncbi:hypothetical protein [Corynebacterium sp. 335C]
MNEELTLPGGARGPAARNLRALTQRAVAMDANALLRVHPRDDGARCDVWTTTPFDPVGVRALDVTPSRPDMAVRAATVLSALTADAESGSADDRGDVVLRCGGAADASWPGALPPTGGYRAVDVVPAAVLRDLEARARGVAAEESGPMGLPPSLLDQEVLTVSVGDEPGEGDDADESSAGAPAAANAGEDAAANAGETAAVTMREVFALCGLGFIPAEPTEDEPVRVSVRGRHLRIDGRFGSVFASAGIGGVLPL